MYDSGDAIERYVAEHLKERFNINSEGGQAVDERSPEKGPEPESVVVGRVGDATLAFVGLERTSAIAVFDAGESQLLALMNENVARYPALKLFSLPSFLPDGGRRLELGVRGDPALVGAAIDHLREGVRALGFRFSEIAPPSP